MTSCPTALTALVESGEAIRLRKSAGITQATLSTALRVSPAAVCRYEHGQRLPSPAPAAAWLRILRGLARHEQAWPGDDP